MPNLSPILPPCALEGREIQALYAGRFVALPWEELQSLAERVFPGDGAAVLQTLHRAARSQVAPSNLQQATAVYGEILRRASGALSEEVEHHEALVATPLWGLQNALALCERLHLVRAQGLHGRGRGRGALRRALGHAFRLHLLRRYLDRQKWAVVEVLFHLPLLATSPTPWREISSFEATYGAEAGGLLTIFWEAASRQANRERWLRESRTLLLAALDVRRIVQGRWTSLLDRGIETLYRETSALVEWTRTALAAVEDGQGLPLPGPPVSVRRTVFEYLLAVRGGGLLGILAARVARYVGPDAGAAEAASLPALRTYSAAGEILIVDPASLTTRSSTLNHPGMENMLPELSEGPGRDGYLVDQYLIRRTIQRLADPGGEWAIRLRSFLLRWTATGEEDRRAVCTALDALEPLVDQIALAAVVPCSAPLLRRGLFSEEMLAGYRGARDCLLARLAAEARTDPRRPLFFLLDAYYMHGL